jgi:hypothetical protein
METPIVFAHVAKRSTDTTLRCNGMTSGWEDLANTRGFQPFFHHAEGRSQTGATRANHNHIVLVFDNVIC